MTHYLVLSSGVYDFIILQEKLSLSYVNDILYYEFKAKFSVLRLFRQKQVLKE